ncbi:hypothetical protein QQS21_000762 [Conoideocrella luteorostrata]|uniref:HAUS augmin-like complex subunit 6 N-terminal domain-containing protein n=1 Tax=Conoideocrella luteorostrata TaxID=1105319 RepID=A0AAJ0G3U9_9HYPO|nr:hypothetical protein QQS21_000762 [Conoideocrella luteorostrata]
MAAVQPRTRLRVNTTSSTSRSKPAAATSTNQGDVGASNAGTSPLSIFLTNLRLLDLDLLPDWPDVTTKTFAATGVQGQKRRIQCVEWVLVKLFGIWDPEETASKLNPFFPPLDQMQSINLRAALLRALETAKKNGVLSRDLMIRKTMLDDCKGERLEEILAYFSTAVLKKILEGDVNVTGVHPAIAVNLSFENRGYDSDNTELHVLGLAYKASLRRTIEQRENTRARFHDFKDLLSVKGRGVTRRMETVRAKEADSNRDTLSNNAREEMRRLVRNDWAGNESWMETLIKGDVHAQGTSLLAMPFDRVWRRVEQDRLAEIEEDSGGLLDQLEHRVRIQKERVARWDMFRKDAFGQLAQGSASPLKKRTTKMESNKGIDFRFSAHHDLQVEKMSRPLPTGLGKTPKFTQEYDDLVTGLKHELGHIKGSGSGILDFVRKTGSAQRRSDNSISQLTDGGEATSDISELEDEPYEAATAFVPVRTNRAKLDSLRRQAMKPQMTQSEVFNQSTSTQSSVSPPHRDGESSSLWRRDLHLPPIDDFEEIEPPPSPTQDMADDILDAMDQASPSPLKRPKQRPTLSLAQRTRLSMAGNHSPFLDEDELELPLRPAASHGKHGPTPPSEPESSSKPRGEDSEAMDLVSRTRQSMAGFEQAQKKAQLERRKSLRRSKVLPRKEGSYFPKVDEEGATDHRVLTEEIIGEEDMEAVFKSRPKMRNSPVGSPIKEW